MASPDDVKTRASTDIFGKLLSQFPLRSDHETEDDVPLIFWLLAGHFRSKPERFNTVGLFRLVSTFDGVYDLKLHISQGNYSYLEEIGDV